MIYKNSQFEAEKERSIVNIDEWEAIKNITFKGFVRRKP